MITCFDLIPIHEGKLAFMDEGKHMLAFMDGYQVEASYHMYSAGRDHL